MLTNRHFMDTCTQFSTVGYTGQLLIINKDEPTIINIVEYIMV